MTKDDDTMMTATTCRYFILACAKKLNRAFTYKDLLEVAEKRYAYGTLRNNVFGLRKDREVLKFPKENPARFITASWKDRPEYKRWFQDDRTPIGGRVKAVEDKRGSMVMVDFVSFIESLDWDELCYVHDVRAEFDVACMPGVSVDRGWCWSSKCHSWIQKFDDFEFPLTVQAFDTGCVQVSVQCSLKPIPFSFGGLTRLTSVLGELKERLAWRGIPNVADWTVTSWHYGKDSRKEISGASFNVTFETWSKTLARIYAKSELKKVRVEEIQSPRRTMQELFHEVINQDLEIDDEGLRKNE